MESLLDLMVKITCDDEASGQVEGISQGIIGKLGKAAKTAAKALAGMWAVKKVVDFGKAAYESYSQFEQLEGGISKLYGNAGMSVEEYAQSVGKSVDAVMADYQRNEQAQTAMMEQAQRAWKTAEMDANTYMQNATMFSASLINSLGGDTAKAAEMTDKAMTAISDNVNTFGTNMESVTDAFRGFSRQNYTMLDNLSLGYAGTKEGMEQLIADANEWGAANGAASDLSIDSFADVVVAIEQIQKKQGIYGTTQREALMTLEGSANATKAAWQNLVTEFGKPDANIAARVADMMTAVFGEGGEGGLARNMVKEVGVIARNIASAVPQLLSSALSTIAAKLPSMVTGLMSKLGRAMQEGAKSLTQFVSDFDITAALFGDDGIVTKAKTFVEKVANGIKANLPMLLDSAGQLMEAIGGAIEKFGPELLEAAIVMWGAVKTAIFKAIPEIVNAIPQLFSKIASFMQQNGPRILSAAAKVFGMIGQAIAENAPEWLGLLSSALGSMVGYVVGYAGQMFEAGVALVAGILDGSTQEGQAVREWFANLPATIVDALGNVGTLLIDVGGKFVDGLVRGIEKAAPNITSAIKTAFQSVIDFFGGIADFLSDPIGSIQRGLDSLNTSFEGTNKSASDNMKGVESSVSGSMGRSSGAITSYNKTKLEGKRATAEVNGNAVSGGARSAVGNTDSAIRNLSNKTVYANVYGSATDNDVANRIWNMVDAIKSLVSKTVNVVTNFLTGGSGNGSGGAWGGIHYHADGGIKIADRFGAGVPFGGAQDRYGEKGPEALIPLTSRYGGDFARMMGEAAAKSMGGGDTYNINLNYEAGTTANEMAYDLVNALQLMQRAGVR